MYKYKGSLISQLAKHFEHLPEWIGLYTVSVSIILFGIVIVFSICVLAYTRFTLICVFVQEMKLATCIWAT